MRPTHERWAFLSKGIPVNSETLKEGYGEPSALSEMLAHAQPGDQETITRLLPLVYGELRALASSYLEHRPGHTLQPTALVHEAYMKLVGGDRAWSGRDHFFATAALAMRQVLVDHARKRTADKRGGGAARAAIEPLEIEASGTSTRELRVLELDELLTTLARADARAAKIAELHLFGGMTQEQIGNVLGVSRATVVTDWQFARAWLASKCGGR